MQLLCQFEVLDSFGWTGLLLCFKDLFCSVLLPSRFSLKAGDHTGFNCMFKAVGLAVLSLLRGMQLNSPSRRQSSSVFVSPTSYDCSAPGPLLDTLLPIPNTESPAFYPFCIKASCVYSPWYIVWWAMTESWQVNRSNLILCSVPHTEVVSLKCCHNVCLYFQWIARASPTFLQQHVLIVDWLT
jgi:hypothetical protein